MTNRINSPDTAADLSVRQAIDDVKSFVIIAGAGSGKTTSLIKGLKYIKDSVGNQLLRKKQRVACITYTTVAEKEIKNDVNDDLLFQVSTIHSFLWELIRPFQSDIKVWVKVRIDQKLNELVEKQKNYGPRVQQRTKEKDQTDIDSLIQQKSAIDIVNQFRYETGSSYHKGILGHSDIIKMVPQLIEEKPLLRLILANRFPFVLVDESQDTLPAVVNALILVDKELSNKFCLSFFGDPMQKIYSTGIGNVPIQETWEQIVKPENFRSPKRVLRVINNIRKNGDGIEQKGGKRLTVDSKEEFIEGSASIFIFENSEEKDQQILKVRAHLAEKNSDPFWINNSQESDLKILVIEHRMAAKRLRFGELFELFKEHASESAFISFSEGTHYAVRAFLQFLIPIIKAKKDNQDSILMDLLRKYCPLLNKDFLKSDKSKAAKILEVLANNITELMTLVSEGSVATFENVYQFCIGHSLYQFDDRITDKLENKTDDIIEENKSNTKLLTALFACPVNQVLGYQTYIEDESVFSTQHSIKGAEFDRVIVVLDDEEGANSTLYSYEKLLGIEALSMTDVSNIAEGKDSVMGRTSRLLYVCCSRAKKDLAVVLFTKNPDEAFEHISTSAIFGKDSIFRVSELT
jgi:DNA helicase-2/ATP-dependent DNA helicase PcrA